METNSPIFYPMTSGSGQELGTTVLSISKDDQNILYPMTLGLLLYLDGKEIVT